MLVNDVRCPSGWSVEPTALSSLGSQHVKEGTHGKAKLLKLWSGSKERQWNPVTIFEALLLVN